MNPTLAATHVTESYALTNVLSRLFVPRNLMGFTLIAVICAGLWHLPDAPSVEARGTLMIFAGAVIAWAVLRWDETLVALVAALSLVALGAVSMNTFYAGMGDELVWLMVGAFVLAAVLKSTGLAERVSLKAVAMVKTPRALFYRLTWVIVATAFVIPSTSGRAALLLPVFLALTTVLKNPQLTRALALLFPTVILLSACASMLGAGAHLVAVEFIQRQGGMEIHFGQWAWLGTPFAVVCSLLATEVILRTFLSKQDQIETISVMPAPTTRVSPQERVIALIVGLTVVLWSTQSWHGLDAPMIAIMGAIAATWGKYTGVSMKQALKNVEWNLILFLAVTLVMGEAMIETGAAHWIAQSAWSGMPQRIVDQPMLVLLAVTLLAMASHLIIVSRSARATVLIPVLALPMATGELAAAGMVFLVTVASGFCQTFSVSAKPVAVYAGLEAPTYSERDLIKLSALLLPVVGTTIMVFALWVWPWQGLTVFAAQ